MVSLQAVALNAAPEERSAIGKPPAKDAALWYAATVKSDAERVVS
jgi:hypothetical protein